MKKIIFFIVSFFFGFSYANGAGVNSFTDNGITFTDNGSVTWNGETYTCGCNIYSSANSNVDNANYGRYKISSTRAFFYYKILNSSNAFYDYSACVMDTVSNSTENNYCGFGSSSYSPTFYKYSDTLLRVQRSGSYYVTYDLSNGVSGYVSETAGGVPGGYTYSANFSTNFKQGDIPPLITSSGYDEYTTDFKGRKRNNINLTATGEIYYKFDGNNVDSQIVYPSTGNFSLDYAGPIAYRNTPYSFTGTFYYASDPFTPITIFTGSFTTPVGTVTGTGTQILGNNHIYVDGYTTDYPTTINYTLTKLMPSPYANIVSTGSLGVVSSGSLNIDISETLTQGATYNLYLYFVDPWGSTIQKNFSFIYNYNEGYEQQDPNNFTFSTSGYAFKPNGFWLWNFIPDPYGGKIKFEIVQPNGTGTTTVVTREFGPVESDGLGYGFSTAIKVEYPYHPVPGTYQVRPIYTINGIEVYPFGTDYNSYVITEAETNYVGGVESVEVVWDDCDADDDGDISALEFTQCGVEKVKTGVNGIWTLIKQIINLGNVEGGENIMSFIIPTANANELVDGFNSGLRPGPLQPIVDYMKYGALFILLLMTLLILVILINNKKS